MSQQMKFGFWMCLTNFLVFLVLNSDLFNAVNQLANYFAVSHVTVSILDTIGLNDKSSMFSVESLCTFSFP